MMFYGSNKLKILVLREDTYYTDLKKDDDIESRSYSKEELNFFIAFDVETVTEIGDIERYFKF